MISLPCVLPIAAFLQYPHGSKMCSSCYRVHAISSEAGTYTDNGPPTWHINICALPTLTPSSLSYPCPTHFAFLNLFQHLLALLLYTVMFLLHVLMLLIQSPHSSTRMLTSTKLSATTSLRFLARLFLQETSTKHWSAFSLVRTRRPPLPCQSHRQKRLVVRPFSRSFFLDARSRSAAMDMWRIPLSCVSNRGVLHTRGRWRSGISQFVVSTPRNILLHDRPYLDLNRLGSH